MMVLSIETIMGVRQFFGFYYKISSNKLVCALLRAYCVFIATILCFAIYYALIANTATPTKNRLLLQGFVYTANVIINLSTNGENFKDFLNKIRNIRITENIDPGDKIPISRCLFIFMVFARLFCHATFHVQNPQYTIKLFTASTLVILIDIIQYSSNFPRIMMLELLWHRMTMLRKRLEQDLSIARRYEDGEVVIKKKLRNILNIYKSFLNTTRETEAPMKPLIFLAVTMLVPKTLNSIYAFGVFSGVFKNYVVILEILTEFIVSISVALLAEMVNSEIDKMKLCIIKQLLVCKGDITGGAIQDAMMYFQQHPFKYTIWHLFTLNMSMILSLIGLLTTYTVAMVQFAHFFD